MPSPVLLVGLIGLGWILQSRLRRALARRRTALPSVPACKVVLRGQGLRPHGLDEISVMSFNVLADQVGRPGRRGVGRLNQHRAECLATTPSWLPATLLRALKTHPTMPLQFACNQKLLQYVHPDHLAWGHRKPLIVAEIATIDADLCCLQEVDTERWQELLDLLPGYEGILQEKKGVENGSACALLYKPGARGGPQEWLPIWTAIVFNFA